MLSKQGYNLLCFVRDNGGRASSQEIEQSAAKRDFCPWFASEFKERGLLGVEFSANFESYDYVITARGISAIAEYECTEAAWERRDRKSKRALAFSIVSLITAICVFALGFLREAGIF